MTATPGEVKRAVEIALTARAAQLGREARSHALCGEAYRNLRAVLRKEAALCSDLARKVNLADPETLALALRMPAPGQIQTERR